MVMQLGAAETGNARNALGELARRYWYPVYVYIRRCGHPRAGATDLAGRFLRQLMADVAGQAGSSPHGHYRSYLLAQLNSFLAANPAEPEAVSGAAGTNDAAAGEDLDMPLDLEERYQQDHIDALTPEQSYQRAFALQVLHRTLRRLRNEASQTGHTVMYDQLEPFLAREPAPGEYELVATRLRSRPLTVVVALKRLRQRFRELAGEELADTVATADDLASEQEALLAVLSDIRP